MTEDDTSNYVAESALSEKPQARYEPSGSAPSAKSPSASQRDYLQLFMNAAPSMMTAGILGAAVAIVVAAAVRFASPPSVTYRTGVNITMVSSNPSQYPNGMAFGIADLRSPVVLEEVFKANKLQDLGLKYEDFSGMVSVSPYSPLYESTVRRYQGLLANKTLSFEERKGIESEFSATVSSLTAKGLVVSLSVPDSGKIPDGLATKIVDDIPAKWGEVYINRFGAANLAFPTSGKTIIDAELVGELDYPLAYDYLNDQAGIVKAQLESLAGIAGTSSYISVKTGNSLADLERSLDTVMQYRLALGLKPIVERGLSRDSAATVAVYDNLAKSLDQDAVSQIELSKRLSVVLADFNAQSVAFSTPASSASGISLTQPADIGLINRLIELSNRPVEFEFEKKLLDKKLDYETAGATFSDKRARAIERRNAIERAIIAPDDRMKLEAGFGIALERSVNELNQLWSQVLAMADELNLSRLNNDKRLYVLSQLPDNERIEKPAMLSTNSLLLALIIGFLSAVAGLVYSIWRDLRKVVIS